MEKSTQNQPKTEPKTEQDKFFEIIKSPPMQVNPCFMTGRACVYSQQIENKVNINSQDKKEHEGFVIMPFRPNISLYFKNCLKPFIEETYKIKNSEREDIKTVKVNTASQVRRPGVIICEGICKRIQESDFVVIDLSLPNSNVFYEFGLAYGLDQKIVIIYKTVEDRNSRYILYLLRVLEALGLKANEEKSGYHNLDPYNISNSNKSLPLSEVIQRKKDKIKNVKPSTNWVKNSKLSVFYSSDIDFKDSLHNIPSQSEPNINLNLSINSNKIAQIDSSNNVIKDHHEFEDINLNFETQVKSAIGISISKIAKELEKEGMSNDVAPNIDALKDAEKFVESEPNIQRINIGFSKEQIISLREHIDECYCFFVRTGGEMCNPMAYFWLGYCHAIGKNVIPITEIESTKSKVDDLAFDIRAHRHITFIKEKPELFTEEIKETLELMILKDFKDIYRKRFWNSIIGKGSEISIFTGALHSPNYNREMIGDWDLLSVSELTSYFGKNQFRFKIEAPTYPPEKAYKESENIRDKMSYIKQLCEKMENKNCIIIASPDVNPLTEIVFGKLFGLPEDKYYTNYKSLELGNEDVWIATKTKKRDDPEDGNSQIKRTFYNEIPLKIENEIPESGLISSNGNTTFMKEKPSVDNKSENKYFAYGHLFVTKNPFPENKNNNNDKYIIVLNGVGGPATFALTHVLTGGETTEFTLYKKDNRKLDIENNETKKEFNPEIASERILKKFNTIFDDVEHNSIEAIIEVSVSGEEQKDESNLEISDWRRIKEWKIIGDLRARNLSDGKISKTMRTSVGN
jgi:hypothetical protein